jgi:hypothetical protein
MTGLPPPTPIREVAGVDFVRFHQEIRPANRPVVMRGLVRDWPAVVAALEGDRTIVDYLIACRPRKPVGAIAARPEENGRFFYNRDLTGFNFVSGRGPMEMFLRDLLAVGQDVRPPAMAMQSEVIPDVLPAFGEANGLPLLTDVPPRMWIGNRIRVSPHCDLMENVACVVAGRRRFTLFPPEQVANLYPGPFELTPAGTPVSMVDPHAPDLERYPRFRAAWAAAQQAELSPGDALYIPYMWWHGVDSLEPVSILVNYWWSNVPKGLSTPYDAMLHNILAFRHLPATERAVWRTMLDHYIFEANGDPAAHLPEHARGMMGPPTPELFARLKATLRKIVSD